MPESFAGARPIPSRPGYFVTANGQMFNAKGRPLAGYKHPKLGYIGIALKAGGKMRFNWIHRFVLEAFVGPAPEGHEAGHMNGIRNDNRLENLRWITPAQNRQQIIEHGHLLQGEQASNAKLTESQVMEIRRLYKAGAIRNQLAKQFGVSFWNVADICASKTWKNLPL